MQVNEILEELKAVGNEEDRLGKASFGINISKAFGIRMPVLRDFAKILKTNQQLALELWNTEYQEARILAALISDPKQFTPELMDSWIKDFNSWDVCDQTCMGPFRKTKYAFEKAIEWSYREREFEKRAGFALMATLAVHEKKKPDDYFYPFLDRIVEEANDNRNFVKKAVNWALRQIGKKNITLNEVVIPIAEKLMNSSNKTEHWVGGDAYNELTGDKVKEMLLRKKK